MADPKPPKGFENYQIANPSPLTLNPGQEIKLPLGYETYVPQTETDFNKDVAPYAGRLAANSLPLAGSFAGPGGTMMGAGARGLLRELAPELFGEPPANNMDFAVEGGKDLLFNNAIPSAIGKVAGITIPQITKLPGIRNLPSVREGAAREMSRQVMAKYQHPESMILETSGENALGKFTDLNASVAAAKEVPVGGSKYVTAISPEAKEAIKELENTFGKNKVGQKLAKLQQEFEAGADIAKSQEYQEISNLALKDLIHVRNWKLATGDKGVQELAINRLLTKGTKETDEALDAKAILKELSGPSNEIYNEAISKSVMQQFKNLVGEIESQQAGHGISDALVRWSGGHLLWGLAGLSSSLGPVGAAASSIITLDKMVLSRAMQNPETAKLVVAAMRTPASAPQASLLNKALQTAFRVGGDLATVPEK